jgi:hypothetical protein
VWEALKIEWYENSIEKLRGHYVALQISLGVNRPDSTISACALQTPLVNFGISDSDLGPVKSVVNTSVPTLGDLLNVTSQALRPNSTLDINALVGVYLKLEYAAKPIIFHN